MHIGIAYINIMRYCYYKYCSSICNSPYYDFKLFTVRVSISFYDNIRNILPEFTNCNPFYLIILMAELGESLLVLHDKHLIYYNFRFTLETLLSFYLL